MEEKELHMIGNAHLDLVWLWPLEEGMHEAKSTFRSALDRIKEYDDFVFTTSTAAVFAWIEKNDPAMFEEIREQVEKGKICLAGGWWVEPDCNIPCGESFVRQALYGQRYFKEKFGKIAKTAYNVDSFGHSGSLPQIMRKSGMTQYVMMRPMAHEKGLPSYVFTWESDDGSRVKCFRILYEYLSWGKAVDYHMERCAMEMTDSHPSIMCFYGVGNHGGGPTIENIESIQAYAKCHPEYGVRFSTPDKYFEAVEKNGEQLPVIHGELLHHSAGCYSAHSGIKKMNRLCENNLLMAEKFSAVAQQKIGTPSSNLEDAWKKLLLNQFHDILAGTSLRKAYEDAQYALGGVVSCAKDVIMNATQAISWNIDIPLEPECQPLVVFNPVGQAICTPVSFDLYAKDDEKFTVLDSQGNEIVCQNGRASVLVNGRRKVSFIAPLPAFGYETYRIYRKEIPCVGIVAGDTFMESSSLRVEFDPRTGDMVRLFDKKNKQELVGAPSAVPLVIEDMSDTWSHDVTRFNKIIGRFLSKSVSLVETGPVYATIRVVSEYEKSSLIQEFTLYEQLDRVDVRAKMLWNDKQKMVKLAFPLKTFFNKYCYETAFGYTERGNTGEEYPVHSWIDATGVYDAQGDVYGLSFINDCKYSGSIEKNTLYLTVLRSPAYAHHEPYILKEDECMEIIDQGVQYFSYSICPHKGKWEKSGLEALAQNILQPAIIVPETFHKGTLPQQDCFAEFNKPNIMITAIKRAENNSGIVLRAYETQKTETDTVLSLHFCNREIPLHFTANEIKTILVPDDVEKQPSETNLLELTESEE